MEWYTEEGAFREGLFMHRYSLPSLWAASPVALAVVVCGVAAMVLSVFLMAGHWLRVRWAAITGRPPLITGWLPWLGAAITFGRAKPALFLRQCQEKVLLSFIIIYSRFFPFSFLL